jgi:hypothetical protein
MLIAWVMGLMAGCGQLSDNVLEQRLVAAYAPANSSDETVARHLARSAASVAKERRDDHRVPLILERLMRGEDAALSRGPDADLARTLAAAVMDEASRCAP